MKQDDANTPITFRKVGIQTFIAKLTPTLAVFKISPIFDMYWPKAAAMQSKYKGYDSDRQGRTSWAEQSHT